LRSGVQTLDDGWLEVDSPRTRVTVVDACASLLLGQQILQLAAVTGPDFLRSSSSISQTASACSAVQVTGISTIIGRRWSGIVLMTWCRGACVPGHRRGRGLLELIGIALDGDDLGVVHQAVDQRDDAGGVRKDFVPFSEGTSPGASRPSRTLHGTLPFG
jgi:hypothetical protein